MPGSRWSLSRSRPRSSSGGSSSAAARPAQGQSAGGARSASPRGRRWRSRAAASGSAATVPPVVVRELELDLDAFEGPFDLLLTLVLKEELDLAEVDVAGIVVAFCEQLAERGELDLEACGEFLVLVSALLELKARGLFPDEDAELSELEPEEAAEEVARRLAPQEASSLAAALRARAAEPPAVSLAHMALRFPPVSQFLERFRAVL